MSTPETADYINGFHVGVGCGHKHAYYRCTIDATPPDDKPADYQRGYDDGYYVGWWEGYRTLASGQKIYYNHDPRTPGQKKQAAIEQAEWIADEVDEIKRWEESKHTRDLTLKVVARGVYGSGKPESDGDQS